MISLTPNVYIALSLAKTVKIRMYVLLVLENTDKELTAHVWLDPLKFKNMTAKNVIYNVKAVKNLVKTAKDAKKVKEEP